MSDWSPRCFRISSSLIHSPFTVIIHTDHVVWTTFHFGFACCCVFLWLEIGVLGGGERSAFSACGSRGTRYERILQLIRVT